MKFYSIIDENKKNLEKKIAKLNRKYHFKNISISYETGENENYYLAYCQY